MEDSNIGFLTLTAVLSHEGLCRGGSVRDGLYICNLQWQKSHKFEELLTVITEDSEHY